MQAIDILNTQPTTLIRDINAPYVHAEVSTLGGASRASLIVKVSKDDRQAWVNQILHNSRYAMFYISNDGTMELFAKHYLMPKFRRTKVNTIQDIVNKINKYLESKI